jgi:hypothetical protein
MECKKNFKISHSEFLVSRRFFELLIRKNVELSIGAYFKIVLGKNLQVSSMSDNKSPS